MFRIKDTFFDALPCPELKAKSKCTILNCVFNHDPEGLDSKRRSSKEEVVTNNRKKAKVDAQITEKVDFEVKPRSTQFNNQINLPKKTDLAYVLPKAITHVFIPRSERTLYVKKLAELYTKKEYQTPNIIAIDKEFEIASQSRNGEDYKLRMDILISPGHQKRKTDPKYILPKEVKPMPPATLQERKGYIKILVDLIKKNIPEHETPVSLAIEEEYEVACANKAATYRQAIRQKVHRFNKPADLKQKRALTDDDMYSRLELLVISKDVLSKFGYITDVPFAEPPDETQTCRRCKNDFKLHEQLRETECLYHSGKIIKKAARQRVYECCGLDVGDAIPCSKCSHHVFYWKNKEQMHHAIPFRSTAELYGIKSGSFKAIGIDCEMGFTTLGFELLRITAVDFFTGEEVLDVLVKPKGEVIDLNTRWSGIAEIAKEAMTFEDSIEILGEVVDSNTILIGHGLENDLNLMRLIHHRVVDTAILFPKHKTSPTYRFPLKYLTFRYLGRTIQEGEHDSKEDSIAAIDVVKFFIKEDSK